MGWYHRVGRWMFLRSGYGCSDYVSMLSTTCLYTYDHTSSHSNLSEPYDSPSASTCNHATPAHIHFRRTSRVALLSTDVRWLIAYTPGRPSVGSGPALEHQNRPHPSGGGDDISRACGFWMLKNTRIASERYRIPPARI